MVERQYDILRRERMKGMEDQKFRPDDVNTNSNSSNEPTNANVNNEENHQREVFPSKTLCKHTYFVS